MSLVFQNLAGLQNRYPLNQWQELLGNCDVQLFLGCTDALTAEYISERSGVASVAVSSKAKQLGTWRISNYTPEYRETSGVGKRNLLTPDEVLRLPLEKALVIIRGQKLLQVAKYDYSLHPEAKLLQSCKASTHVPNWRLEQEKSPHPAAAPPPKPAKTAQRKEKAAVQNAPKKGAVTKTDKSSIMD
jgi:type IV secretion system protein VirD4